jgi:methanogenic corrinoid protein MtbC1
VSPELLRAWERRYGLLRPSRSPGGFRLYSEADEARIRHMKAHLARGVAAAEAARLADQVEIADSPGGSVQLLSTDLTQALDGFDEARAQRVLDVALASFSVDAVIADLLLPYLRELGNRWESGEISVAQEHFASNLIRTRMLALARSWDAGVGPRALLACPENELHDLGMALFGVALSRRGWRITFLGANTPLPTIIVTARNLKPDVIVLALTDPQFVLGNERLLAGLADEHRLVLAGRGAAEVAAGMGVEAFLSDPVTAAEQLTVPG